MRRRPNIRQFNRKPYSKVRVLPNLNFNQRRILSQRVQKLRANGINIRTVGWANGEIGVYARKATRKSPLVYNKRETRKPRRKGSPLKRQPDSIRKLARTRNLNEMIQSGTMDRELTDLELFMEDYGYGGMDFDIDNEDMMADWEEFMADLDSEYYSVDMAIKKNEKDSESRALFGLRSGGKGFEEIVRWAVGENIIETGMNPSNQLGNAKLIMTEEEFERLDFSTPEAPRYNPSQQGIVGAELPDANTITMLSIPEYVALPVVTVRSSGSPWSDNPDAWNMKAAYRLDDTLLTATKELDDVFATGQADYSQTKYPGEVAFLNAIAAKAPYAIDVAKQGQGRERLNANDADIEEEAERLSLYRDNEITVVAIDTAVFSGRRGDFEGIRITPDNELEFDGDDGYYIDGEWVERDEIEADGSYLEKYGTNFADQLTNQIAEDRGWGDRREWKDGLAQLWFRGVKLREKDPGDYDDPNFANQFNFAITEWGESGIANWLEVYGGSPHLLTEVELEDEWNPGYHGIWQSEVVEELTERGINFTEAGRRYRMDGSIETPAEAKERFENMLDRDGDSIKGFLRGSWVNWDDVPDEDISLEIERRKWQMRG